MGSADQAVVLVVEDEPDVAETYERWLRSSYDVRMAEDGQAALDQLDESLDVVLLDRMMPGMAGDEVLAEIRDRGLDCRVAMVTAVDADFDVIEMGFDAYVAKPPERDELIEMIERLLDRTAVDEDLQQYYSLVARKSALQETKTVTELEDSDEYADLLDRIEEAREAADADLGDLSADDNFVGAVREIMGDGEPGAPDTNADGSGVGDSMTDGKSNEGDRM